MDKPQKPTNLLPRSFGGIKENWTQDKRETGYEADVPAMLTGPNLNYLLDTIGPELEYTEKIADFVNGLPINNFITTDENNKLIYKDLKNIGGASLPIGTLYPSFAAAGYVPEFAVPADGAEYSGAQFPGLWSDYLTASTPKLLTKNYTRYQADITAYGKCAAFGVEHTISATHTGTGITDVEVTAATWETKVSRLGSMFSVMTGRCGALIRRRLSFRRTGLF